jgi:hypothetical protein
VHDHGESNPWTTVPVTASRATGGKPYLIGDDGKALNRKGRKIPWTASAQAPAISDLGIARACDAFAKGTTETLPPFGSLLTRTAFLRRLQVVGRGHELYEDFVLKQAHADSQPDNQEAKASFREA